MTLQRHAPLLCGLLGSLCLWACETSPPLKPRDGAPSLASRQAQGEETKAPSAAPQHLPSEPSPALPESPEPESEQLTKLCQVLCKQTESLKCGTMEACVQGCSKSFGLPICQEHVAKFITCLMQQPLSAWMCSPGGTPSLREGMCGAEQEAIVSCLQAQVNTAAPPTSPTQP
jgi:hypothetical protein